MVTTYKTFLNSYTLISTVGNFQFPQQKLSSIFIKLFLFSFHINALLHFRHIHLFLNSNTVFMSMRINEASARLARVGVNTWMLVGAVHNYAIC